MQYATDSPTGSRPSIFLSRPLVQESMWISIRSH